MFSRLLTSSTRSISSSMRHRIITHPKRQGEKLTRTAIGVFVKKNFKAAAKGKKNSIKVLVALRKKFLTLSASQTAKYKKVAKKNLGVIKRRQAAFKAVRTNGFGLFVKQNFKLLPKEVRNKGVVAAMKSLSKQWKSLGKSRRGKYVATAAKISKIATKQRDRMIAQYKA